MRLWAFASMVGNDPDVTTAGAAEQEMRITSPADRRHHYNRSSDIARNVLWRAVWPSNFSAFDTGGSSQEYNCRRSDPSVLSLIGHRRDRGAGLIVNLQRATASAFRRARTHIPREYRTGVIEH